MKILKTIIIVCLIFHVISDGENESLSKNPEFTSYFQRFGNFISNSLCKDEKYKEVDDQLKREMSSKAYAINNFSLAGCFAKGALGASLATVGGLAHFNKEFWIKYPIPYNSLVGPIVGSRLALVSGMYMLGKSAFDATHYFKAKNEGSAQTTEVCQSKQSFYSNLSDYFKNTLIGSAVTGNQLGQSSKTINPLILLLGSYVSLAQNTAFLGQNLINASRGAKAMGIYLAFEAAYSASCRTQIIREN